MARYRHRMNTDAWAAQLPLDGEALLWLARACLSRLENDPDEEDIPRALGRVLGVETHFDEVKDKDDEGDDDGQELSVVPVIVRRHRNRPATRVSDRVKLLESVQTRVEALEAAAGGPGQLMKVAMQVAQTMGLDDVETRALAFIAGCAIHTEFELLANVGNAVSTRREQMATVARAIDVPARVLQVALARRSRLQSRGVIQHNDRSQDLVPFTPNETVLGLFGEEVPSSEQVLGKLLAVGTPPRFGLEDFAHQPGIDVVTSLLAGAIEARRKGVHILLHGEPGTGKSEMARTVAKALQTHLCEVPTCDEDGDPLMHAARASSLRLLDAVASSRGGRFCLLVDEAEDLLPIRDRSHFSGLFDAPVSEKSFFNELLERTSIPVIWTANCAERLDPAHLRRFAAIVEVRSPPEARRAAIARDLAERHGFDRALLADAVRNDRIPISFLDTLAQSVTFAGATNTVGIAPIPGKKVVDQLTNGYLGLTGGKPVSRPRPTALRFDPSLVNASIDLEEITRRLVEHPQATILLSGPPGTGKSAWARRVAEALNRPLHVVSPSDILSKWVGEAERNLARAFTNAEAEGGVLLLDEADTFLFPRGNAAHSWEVSHTNEMLVRVESFAGIFIATTNDTGRMDDAVHRRFDLKVQLSPLTLAQRQSLLTTVCGQLGLPPPTATSLAAIGRLDGLCTGDVVAVERRLRFSPVATVDALVEVLSEEVGTRRGRRAPIGFSG